MPREEFLVRRASPADAGTIARHRAAMFRDMGRLADDAAERSLREAAEIELRQWLSAGTYLGWLAIPAGRAD